MCVCCTVFVNVCPPLQVARLQESLTEAKSESAVLREKVATMTTTLEQQRQSDEEEREGLKKRADGLTQQNSLLHEEAEKMAARIITLQEQGRSKATPTVSVTTGTVATETESSTDQLWEIIRSVFVYIRWNFTDNDTSSAPFGVWIREVHCIPTSLVDIMIV